MKQALPGGAAALCGSLAWSLAMGSSAWLSGALKGKAFGGSLGTLVLTFAIGGLAGFVPALFAYRLLRAGKSASQRYALAFLALAAATIVCTSLTFTLIFRSYYAQWHDGILTGHWLEEQFFTLASAGYQFAVLGLRSFLPLGLAALFAASWLLSKKPV
jgi:hypothetical protein